MPQTFNTLPNLKNLVRPIKGSPNRALKNLEPVPVPNLYPQPVNLIDPSLDDLWAQQYFPGLSDNSTYFDYFFSGQDILVSIDGTQTDPNYSQMPINYFGFNIDQTYMPIFGYSSYVYDALAKGQRIITGQFILVTRSPDYLLQAIALSAYNRHNNLSSIPTGYTPPLTEDAANILTYWGTNQDNSINTTAGQYNLFSEHPPFTFMVQYGIQDTSVNTNLSIDPQLSAFNQPGITTDGGVLDINDRLVLPNSTDQQYMMILLDGCQLINFKTAIDTTGKPIGEVYSFIAHDVIYPPPSQASQQTL